MEKRTGWIDTTCGLRSQRKLRAMHAHERGRPGRRAALAETGVDLRAVHVVHGTDQAGLTHSLTHQPLSPVPSVARAVPPRARIGSRTAPSRTRTSESTRGGRPGAAEIAGAIGCRRHLLDHRAPNATCDVHLAYTWHTPGMMQAGGNLDGRAAQLDARAGPQRPCGAFLIGRRAMIAGVPKRMGL